MTPGAVSGLFLTLLAAGAARLTAADAVDELLPGHWLEVPDSRLDVHDPAADPALNPNWPAEAPWHGVEGLSGIMDDWSSAAYDTLRGRLAVWGGGHSGYAGNEIYVFDVHALRWERITDPAVDVSVTGTTLYADGTPRARETYNYLQYVPAIDRMVSFGGGNLYPCCHYTNETAAFDFDALAWDTTAHAPHPGWGNAFGAIAAVDDATGHVWYVPSGAIRIAEFDPLADTWALHAEAETLLYRNGAIDPARRKLVWFGWHGDTVALDLDAPSLPPATQPTSGDTWIESVAWPGVAHDPVRGLLVAWGGGADVYTLDTQSWVWTCLAPDPANTVIPTPPNRNGTHGRFRYVPSRDVFILVNSVDENVYFYRMPGSPVDSDADGLADSADNCMHEANGPGQPDAGGRIQRDSDRDGIGNPCDADIALPNDCRVDFADLAEVRRAFYAVPGATHWNPDADFNGDRIVNFEDLGALKLRFFANYHADNPSGIANECMHGD